MKKKITTLFCKLRRKGLWAFVFSIAMAIFQFTLLYNYISNNWVDWDIGYFLMKCNPLISGTYALLVLVFFTDIVTPRYHLED